MSLVQASEATAIIFQFLSAYDLLASACLVCKQWHDLIQNKHIVWRSMMQFYFNEPSTSIYSKYEFFVRRYLIPVHPLSVEKWDIKATSLTKERACSLKVLEDLAFEMNDGEFLHVTYTLQAGTCDWGILHVLNNTVHSEDVHTQFGQHTSIRSRTVENNNGWGNAQQVKPVLVSGVQGVQVKIHSIRVLNKNKSQKQQLFPVPLDV